MIRRRLSIAGPAGLARLTLFASTAFFVGCGQAGDHPPVYSVKGTVLFKGKPISAGVVLFELEGDELAPSKSAQVGGPLRATGRIEADGSFRLVAFQGADGVPAGNYKVGISSVPPRSEANLLDAGARAKKGNPDVLGGRYSDPKKSGLRTQVLKDQTNEPVFDLN